jgi:hypothetical protein
MESEYLLHLEDIGDLLDLELKVDPGVLILLSGDLDLLLGDLDLLLGDLDLLLGDLDLLLGDLACSMESEYLLNLEDIDDLLDLGDLDLELEVVVFFEDFEILKLEILGDLLLLQAEGERDLLCLLDSLWTILTGTPLAPVIFSILPPTANLTFLASLKFLLCLAFSFQGPSMSLVIL